MESKFLFGILGILIAISISLSFKPKASLDIDTVIEQVVKNNCIIDSTNKIIYEKNKLGCLHNSKFIINNYCVNSK